MEITRNEEGAYIISELEPPLVEFLEAIPGAADPEGSSAAMERLFPSPTDHAAASKVPEEWQEYVHPELRHWFESAAATVRTDLKQVRSEDVLTIAPKHVDAWLNTLNQARLTLAARFGITEADMELPVSHILENKREIALFQIHFYGFLQECLIRGGENGEG